MSKTILKYVKNRSQEIRIETPKFVLDDNKWKIDKDSPAGSSSYFWQEYEDALEIVNGIIEFENKYNSHDLFNNRILFIGQRGAGKTSSMKSFAHSLEEARSNNIRVFSCLPMVDPNHLDKNSSLLQTVITRMYSGAEKLMHDGGNSESIIALREQLIKQFDKVLKSIKALFASEKSSYTLEWLNEKSKSLQIRDGIRDLVSQYIEFYNKVNKTNMSYLVLMIDDIDMTVSHAHEMLEQLWKYLDVDKLIILISANLSQLMNEIREHYSKSFEETLKDAEQAKSIDVEDMASKYLLKLFPASHRVRVEHNISLMLDTTLTISNGNKTEDVVESGDLQKVVLTLIWEKTRLLFIPKDAKSTLHPIIPTNLRELMQFLDMLTSLKEVRTGEQHQMFEDIVSYENCRDNVDRFKKYFIHNWIPEHLSVEEELVFNNIPADITEVNKHLINSINVIGTNHKRSLMSREVDLDIIERNAENVNIDRDIYTMVSPNDPKFVKANKISDIFNQPSNYSYGDLLLMIDKYETYFESEKDRRFSNAIKIYYTILLFDTMFFKSTDVNYDVTKPEGNDLDEMLIPIQKLIGGTVYYPNYFEIITDKYFNQKGPSYDAKRAFYHKHALKEGEKVDSQCPLFSVLYYGDIRPDRYDTKHIYDTTYEKDASVDGTLYVTFDILSTLSNMLNPVHTIKRANGHVEDDLTNRLEEWGNKCKIGNTDKKTPNSILPFYSVDMMLHYLRKSYSSDEFEVLKEFEEKEETKDIIKAANNYKSIFKNSNPLAIQSSKTVKIPNKEIEAYKTDVIDKIMSYFNKLDVSCEKQHDINVRESFRDYAVSLLLKEYKESRRDLAMLIRDIDKCKGIPDICEYVVKTLWKDTIIEKEVRIQIQNIVHKKDFVDNYYNKLEIRTKTLIEGIELNKNEIWNVYNSIFCNAQQFLGFKSNNSSESSEHASA